MPKSIKYIILIVIFLLPIHASVFASEFNFSKKIRPQKENITGVLISIDDQQYIIETKDANGQAVLKKINFDDKTRFKINKKELVKESNLDLFKKRVKRDFNKTFKFSVDNTNFKIGQTVRIIGTNIDNKIIASLISQTPLIINQ